MIYLPYSRGNVKDTKHPGSSDMIRGVGSRIPDISSLDQCVIKKTNAPNLSPNPKAA